MLVPNRQFTMQHASSNPDNVRLGPYFHINFHRMLRLKGAKFACVSLFAVRAASNDVRFGTVSKRDGR